MYEENLISGVWLYARGENLKINPDTLEIWASAEYGYEYVAKIDFTEDSMVLLKNKTFVETLPGLIINTLPETMQSSFPCENVKENYAVTENGRTFFISFISTEKINERQFEEYVRISVQSAATVYRHLSRQ